MKTRLFNNFGLKVLSLAAAFVLWLIVVNIDDAVTSKAFNNLKVSMLNMEVLTDQGQMCRIEDGTDVVDIKVYARRSVLNQLKPSDFLVTADMQKDLRYDSLVKIDVAYVGNLSNSVIQKIETDRTNVMVHIEKSVTEQFKISVKTDGALSAGFEKGPVVPEQTMIEITGPESVVERIHKVQAVVNITGMTGTQVRTGTLKLLDGNDDEIDGTYLEYAGKDSDFEVTVTVWNKKLAGISFDISTLAPEGYGLNTITYKPETVTIAGLKKDISPIYNLNIPPEVLNPNGETGYVEQIVDISQYLPEGITIPDADEHEIIVTMDIVPLITNTYQVNSDQIQYQNIKEGLELDAEDTAVLEVPVSGIESELAALEPAQIVLTADLSEFSKAGTYTVPVTVTVPEQLKAPETIEMKLKLKKAEEQA